MITTYDHIIKNAVSDHLPGVDWRLLKAQLYQESRLDPNAVSPAGAEGIAQFMPATWGQVAREMRLPSQATPYLPQFAIPAAAYYMRKLWDSWTAKREQADRYFLALASYNAGMGNLLKAQKKATKAAGWPVNDYKPLIPFLELVTGRHNARETVGYVRKIYEYYGELVL